MQDIVVIGAGGHAKVVAQSLRRQGCWRIVGFVDDVSPHRAGEVFGGATVLGTRAVLPQLRSQGVSALALAFGDNRARIALGRQLSGEGWLLPAIVDPSAVVDSSADLGAGVFVGVGAVVEADVRVGDQTIVNSAAVICHDSVVGDGAHLCPRACLGGHARVGDGAWIGIGAVLKDRSSVGAWALLGAGSLVVRDIPGGVVAFGVPARVVRKVTP